jgi:AraC family transcriptional regulator
MKIIDEGVLENSTMDFMIPSEIARKALYYIDQYGHFYCDSHYRIQREHLDSSLLIYVIGGALQVETEGKTFRVLEGETALLDCRRPHMYACESSADFLWFHFSGLASETYCRFLIEQNGNRYSGKQDFSISMRSDFEAIQQYASAALPNEHAISCRIHQILSRMAVPDKGISVNQLIEPVLAHISANYDQEQSLEDLAELCGLSVSHMIRLFKHDCGCTPHDYLVSVRIRMAKLMLHTTDDSVEEIALKCGFNSASHFARSFRKNVGMSPAEFRKMPF